MRRTHWNSRCWFAVGVILALIALPAAAAAGTISLSSFPTPVGPYILNIASVSNLPLPPGNNDNSIGPSGNTLTINRSVFGFGPMDLPLPVVDSFGTREYFVTENITNNTGQDWIGYRLEIGFGQGAGFLPAVAGDGLDFDYPDQDPAPASNFAFATITHGEKTLDYLGGLVPDGATLQLTYSIDLPDLPVGVTSFTLRQEAVPEPSAMGLLIAGGAGLGLVFTWRRLRRPKQ